MIQYKSWCKADETLDQLEIKYQNLKNSTELQAEMSDSHASCWSKTSD